MPWVGLKCVIVVFPDHTHLLFESLTWSETPKTGYVGVVFGPGFVVQYLASFLVSQNHLAGEERAK